MNFSAGEVILIDKPLDWTSFDVVNKIKFSLKKQFGPIKIGHAGTLDPKATGLLMLCAGKKTKDIQQIQDADKEYTGTIYLGAIIDGFLRNCGDVKRFIDFLFRIEAFGCGAKIDSARSFIGAQEQFPPIHSAVKIDGKRAYELARAGKEVAVRSKQITIKAFDITRIELPLIDFRVECTKGTYIRSLANDFGKRLNNGAYLHALRRTKIGQYDVQDAMSIEQFMDKIK